jgi:O-antigen ligase
VTFTERLGIWEFVVHEIGQRPWFGAGFSSFWSINPLVQPSLKTNEWFSLYTIINEGHQGYLDLWATTGLFGLIGSLWVIFRSIGIAARSLNRTLPAAAAWRAGLMGRPTAVFHFTFLLGLLVHNFTESGLFGSSSLFTQLLIIAMLDLEKWRISG